MRLFVAVWPPEEVLAEIESLPRPSVDGLRWTSRDQWHVTLRFMGEVADVDGVVTALQHVSRPGARARATMGPATDRFGQRILHVPVDGLEAVAAAVAEATRSFGRPPEDRAFTGHVTLARARDRRRVDLRPLCGMPLAGEWPVDEVCLVASTLRPHGAQYETVARLALEPAAGG